MHHASKSSLHFSFDVSVLAGFIGKKYLKESRISAEAQMMKRRMSITNKNVAESTLV
jgi:hypothetical protein